MTVRRNAGFTLIELMTAMAISGIVLALVTYLGMAAYVEMPEAIRPVSFLVNLFLVLLVWWCNHRLVWDCTNVDEDADMNAAGLLQVSGMEKKPEEEEVIEAEEREKSRLQQERIERLPPLAHVQAPSLAVRNQIAAAAKLRKSRGAKSEFSATPFIPGELFSGPAMLRSVQEIDIARPRAANKRAGRV